MRKNIKTMRISDPRFPGQEATVKERVTFLRNNRQECRSISDEPTLEEINLCIDLCDLNPTWLISGRGTPFIESAATAGDSDYSDINQRFKEIRLDNRMNQSEMAVVLGKSRSTVSAIEQDRQTLSFSDVRVLKKALKISYTKLIDGVDSSAISKTELLQKNEELGREVNLLKSVIRKLTED